MPLSNPVDHLPASWSNSKSSLDSLLKTSKTLLDSATTPTIPTKYTSTLKSSQDSSKISKHPFTSSTDPLPESASYSADEAAALKLNSSEILKSYPNHLSSPTSPPYSNSHFPSKSLSPYSNDFIENNNNLKKGGNGICYGKVADLEAMVPSTWWKTVFDSMYLKTDGDVVEDPDVTVQEIEWLEKDPEIKSIFLRGSELEGGRIDGNFY